MSVDTVYSPISTSHTFRNQFIILRRIRNGVIALLTLFAFTVLVTISIPIYIYRYIVTLLAPWLRPDLGSCMNAITSFFATDLFADRSPRCTTVLPITIDGNLTKAELLETVQKNWISAVDEEDGELKYPQFRNHACRWLGFPFWKSDPNFNAKNHVFSYSEERRGTENEVVTEQDLDNFVESLLNAQWTPGKSPWELHVVENYKTDTFAATTKTTGLKSVMVMRIHHSLADGFSLLDALVAGLLEVDVKKLKLPSFQYPKRTPWQKLKYYSTVPFTGAYELAKLLSAVFQPCPWKVPDSVKSWRQRYCKSELIPIEKVKYIKSKLGVSFTGVLLSAISAGISKSLEAKKKKGTLRVHQEEDYMVSMSALPMPETKAMRRIRLKNNVTGMVFYIPTNNFPTSLDRLKKCEEYIEACKNSIVPMLCVLYLNSIGWMIGDLPYLIGKNRIISTGLTNFPTKPSNIDTFGGIAGKEVLFAEFASGALVGNAGVGFMVVSFFPYIRLAVTAENALLSRDEIQELVKYIEEELRVLHLIAEEIEADNPSAKILLEKEPLLTTPTVQGAHRKIQM